MFGSDVNESEEKTEEIESKEGVTTKDKEGKVVVNEYAFIKTLGRGSSAKVKLCKSGDLFFASKIFRKSLLSRKKTYVPSADGSIRISSGLTDLYREIAVMKKLNHKNVVCLHDVIYDEETDKLYMMMDYCADGSVMEWDEDHQQFMFPWTSSELQEHQIRKIFRDAICGLEYLHYNNIVHRDIKPQNMLISEDFTVKLADFGQSHIYDDPSMANRSLGTYFFYPPECCGSAEEFLPKPTDVWALGITFYLILFQSLPFSAESEAEMFEKIQSFPLEFPESKPISHELKELIVKMLDKNPSTRITAEGLIADPWVNKDIESLQKSSGEVVSVSDNEVFEAVRSIHSVMFAKQCAIKLNRLSKKLSKVRAQNEKNEEIKGLDNLE